MTALLTNHPQLDLEDPWSVLNFKFSVLTFSRWGIELELEVELCSLTRTSDQRVAKVLWWCTFICYSKTCGYFKFEFFYWSGSRLSHDTVNIILSSRHNLFLSWLNPLSKKLPQAAQHCPTLPKGPTVTSVRQNLSSHLFMVHATILGYSIHWMQKMHDPCFVWSQAVEGSCVGPQSPQWLPVTVTVAAL